MSTRPQDNNSKNARSGEVSGNSEESIELKSFAYRPTLNSMPMELLESHRLQPIGAMFDLAKIALSLSLNDNEEQEQGILAFRPKPGTVKDEEVDQFLQIIKMLFEAFIESLKLKGIDTSKYTYTLDSKGLVIRIPAPNYFDLFIEQLVNDALLFDEPTPNKDVENNLSPFVMCPVPKAKKEEELEEEKRFNPSPFSPYWGR
jgi:hypothetical protein